MVRYRAVSSAKSLTLDLTFIGRSFMLIEREEVPAQTPEVLKMRQRGTGSDEDLFTMTDSWRLSRNPLTHLRAEPRIP